MPSPTQTSGGAICTKVALQGHLSISTTENDGSKTATDFYLVQWNAAVTPIDCEGATDGTHSVPLWGSVNSQDSSRLVRRVQNQPVNNETRLLFQARVEYTSDQTTPTNPLLARPVIEWEGGEAGEVPYFLDNNPALAVPVLNSASDRFADFLTRASGAISATYSVNVPLTGTVTGYNGSSVSAFSPSTVIQYCAGGTQQSTPAINVDSFKFDSITIGPLQARAKSCTCSGVQTQNGVNYRTVKWTLLFKNQWLDVVDDRGFNNLVTNTAGKMVLSPIIKGGTPEKLDFPWPLNGSGFQKPNVTDTPPKLVFYPYPQLAFTPLGFM